MNHRATLDVLVCMFQKGPNAHAQNVSSGTTRNASTRHGWHSWIATSCARVRRRDTAHTDWFRQISRKVIGALIWPAPYTVYHSAVNSIRALTAVWGLCDRRRRVLASNAATGPTANYSLQEVQELVRRTGRPATRVIRNSTWRRTTGAARSVRGEPATAIITLMNWEREMTATANCKTQIIHNKQTEPETGD